MTVLEVSSDITFATVQGQSLVADIYRPAGHAPCPTVLYLHGGGFARGSRKDHAHSRLAAMARLGVAVVSFDYRLAPRFTFPAPLEDVKAALRWLRACGADLGLSVDKLAVWGASAGGYLATMAGLTSGKPDFDGLSPIYSDQSSSVDAVVTWFAPHDLAMMSRRSELEARILPQPHAYALLGIDGPGPEAEARFAAASSLPHFRAGLPPFLIAHGDSDYVVPSAQSESLHSHLSSIGAESSYCLLAQAGHEDTSFDSASHLAMTAAWLKAKLA